VREGIFKLWKVGIKPPRFFKNASDQFVGDGRFLPWFGLGLCAGGWAMRWRHGLRIGEARWVISQLYSLYEFKISVAERAEFLKTVQSNLPIGELQLTVD